MERLRTARPLKSPSGTLSPAEAISVVTSGLTLAAHFGDGRLSAADVAGGWSGRSSRIRCATAWRSRNTSRRSSASATAGATCTAPPRLAVTDGVTVLGIRHHGPGSARSVLARAERLAPDLILVEGPPDGQALIPLAARADMQPPVALVIYPPERAGDRRRSIRSPRSRRSGTPCGLRWRTTFRSASATCPWPSPGSPSSQTSVHRRDEPADPIRLLAEAAGEAIPSAGGSDWSSSAATTATSSKQ